MLFLTLGPVITQPCLDINYRPIDVQSLPGSVYRLQNENCKCSYFKILIVYSSVTDFSIYSCVPTLSTLMNTLKPTNTFHFFKIKTPQTRTLSSWNPTIAKLTLAQYIVGYESRVALSPFFLSMTRTYN